MLGRRRGKKIRYIRLYFAVQVPSIWKKYIWYSYMQVHVLSAEFVFSRYSIGMMIGQLHWVGITSTLIDRQLYMALQNRKSVWKPWGKLGGGGTWKERERPEAVFLDIAISAMTPKWESEWELIKSTCFYIYLLFYLNSHSFDLPTSSRHGWD